MFADRARYYADPGFVQQPVQALLSKSYAQERRQLINANKAAQKFATAEAILQQGDTV